MKTNAPISVLAAVVFATAGLCGTADAGRVRTRGGGAGYHYRAPSVDRQLSRWHESNLIPAPRGRRTRHGVAPLAYFDSSAFPFLQMEFAGKVVIVPRKNAVESVQRALQGLGYYRGPASGTMNRGFEQALRKYQAESGARNTGIVDAETIESLGLDAASFKR
jgi:hypothetical protein